MRELNTKLVLSLIRESDTISHIDIIKKTRLSPGTVTSIIKELKNLGYVRETGPGESSLGRKPRLLAFNSEASYVVSGSFFADETDVAVLDLAGNIKKRISHPMSPEKNPQRVFEHFADTMEQLLRELAIDKEQVLGVGISIEGIVDRKEGRLILGTRMGWRDVPVRDSLEDLLEMRVFVESEGRAMALGEYYYGVGQGVRELVCIDLDAGIGANAVLEGKIFRGSNNMAGEIGHTMIVSEGPECSCGRAGCLEAVASGAAILAKIKTRLEHGEQSELSDQPERDTTREALRAVFQAARKGDKLTLEVIEEAGEYLGRAVAAVINYADPELIVLTGSVTTESQGMTLELIRRKARERVVDSDNRNIRIVEGILGEESALIGGATLVYEDVFQISLSVT